MKKVITILLTLLLALSLAACGTEASRISYNVSKEADNFNVTRRLTAINTRNDTILLELTGTFSIKTDMDGDLNIICELEDGTYQKHFIHVNEWVTYVVEDLGNSEVSKYSYELSFLPQSIGRYVTVTTDDDGGTDNG